MEVRQVFLDSSLSLKTLSAMLETNQTYLSNIDCEITPNRPDCLSMIGMARETGAIFDRDFHVELPAIKMCIRDS